MKNNKISRILFVCLGNICRSPLVETVARKRLAEAGLKVEVASCGTGGWHAGEQADPRMRAAAAGASYDMGSHRARQLVLADFEHYDLLLAMDSDNLREMHRMVGPEVARRTSLFLEWAGLAPPHEFPDPYYGELTGFVQSIVLAEQGVRGMIERLRAE